MTYLNSRGIGIDITHSQDTALPCPYYSSDSSIACEDYRLFWGRETALPCPPLLQSV